MMCQMAANLVAALLEFCVPFLSYYLVNFIQEGDPNEPITWENTKFGVYLSLGLMFTVYAS